MASCSLLAGVSPTRRARALLACVVPTPTTLVRARLTDASTAPCTGERPRASGDSWISLVHMRAGRSGRTFCCSWAKSWPTLPAIMLEALRSLLKVLYSTRTSPASCGRSTCCGTTRRSPRASRRTAASHCTPSSTTCSAAPSGVCHHRRAIRAGARRSAARPASRRPRRCRRDSSPIETRRGVRRRATTALRCRSCGGESSHPPRTRT